MFSYWTPEARMRKAIRCLACGNDRPQSAFHGLAHKSFSSSYLSIVQTIKGLGTISSSLHCEGGFKFEDNAAQSYATQRSRLNESVGV